MKITNDDKYIHGFPADKTAKSSTAPQTDFSSVLKDTIETTEIAEKGVQLPAVVETVVPAQIQHFSASDKLNTLNCIESVLDMLDMYRSKLADPSATLREIDPIVKSLETANEQLKPVLKSIAEGDQLKQILNQTLVTTSLEVFKFYQGDYINP
ncbi:MAG: hypothetical protein PVF56_18910 [Desulfobacterales bacterium]|jgi:exonuclease VII small subunit